MTEPTEKIDSTKQEVGRFVRLLLYCVLFLVAAGWVMLIDAGLIYKGTVDSVQNGRLLYKHGLGVCAGLLFLVSIAFVRPSGIRGFSRWSIVAAVLLLALVFTPIGDSVRGSRRWLDFGPFSFQPLEFAKLAAVWYVADCLARYAPLDTTRLGRILLLSLPLAMIVAMLALQPDLSGAIYILVLVFALAVVGGMSRQLTMGLTGICVLTITALIALNPDKLQRFVPMVSPLSDLDGAGYQVGQSLWAITNGGLFGRGLGGSLAMYSLPDHTNDFVFPIITEEWGLIGGLLIVGLFGLMTYAAFRIALMQNDRFRLLLGCGIASLIGLQAAMNMAVALGWFPTTGVPLPFVSSGGSSVLLTFLMIGLVLNLARTAGDTVELPDSKKEKTIKTTPIQKPGFAPVYRKKSFTGYSRRKSTRVAHSARRRTSARRKVVSR